MPVHPLLLGLRLLSGGVGSLPSSWPRVEGTAEGKEHPGLSEVCLLGEQRWLRTQAHGRVGVGPENLPEGGGDWKSPFEMRP